MVKENNASRAAASSMICERPEDTFELGMEIGRSLKGGELILLTGGLGAGKTLLTKGILEAVGYDIDEVTSPSFTLVNLYQAKFPVYHIDLWRLDENSDAAAAVGLDDIAEDETAVVIVEWAEKLKKIPFRASVIRVNIEGDGDEPRRIEISGPSRR
jgi:tRNA threonylcarbamoyladenosine biosynthesis protein TsaE